MNKGTRFATSAVGTGLAMVQGFSVPAAVVLYVASWFGNVSPTERGFAILTSVIGLWLFVAAAFAAATAMLVRLQYQSGNGGALMVLSGIALAHRSAEALPYFPELLAAIGLLSVAMVVGWLDRPAQAKQLQGQVLGREEQPAAAAKVAIRYPAVKPRHAFAQVVGMSEVKGRLLGAGKDVVAHFKSGQARNGILLTGKPGNGKTFLAEALAGELHLPFISVAYGDVASKWINETTENVVQVFRDAAAQAPCVLFLDEIDSLIGNRSGNAGSDESAKTTNAILTELVNIRRAGVVVIAASNFVDRLDPAAIREGRFDFKIEITPPDAPARKHLITSKVMLAISDETIDIAVRRWEGFSVARISAVVDEANRLGRADGLITFQVLQAALRAIQGRKGSIPEGTPRLQDLSMRVECKQRLLALARRMENIMEIEAMGGSVPRGVLFYGPPGTGKTLAARALALSANWAFLSVSGMDFIADPGKIDKLVEEASELRPCVVFIDEADDVFKDRRFSNTATITNKLLAAIDGSGGKIPDVVFVAATNHPDAMDAAALRGGRFTEKVEFSLPDEQTLLEVLRKWQDSTAARLAPCFGLEQAAIRLHGNSMADVREILQMAVNNAISRLEADAEVAVVEMQDLDLAVLSVRGSIS